MKSDATNEGLAGKHVVLLGVGHTNAHVVKMWGMNPIPGADLTCLSDNAIATYSGMLPAVLAGQIPPDDMEIDLVRLCSSVGARLITNPVQEIDVAEQVIRFSSRPAIPFDVLSIGIGSVPTVAGVEVEGSTLLKIKPMQTFLHRLETAVQAGVKKAEAADPQRPLEIVIAGSGVAGLEIAFCLPGFLKTRINTPFSVQILTRSDEILSGVIPPMRKRVQDELDRCGVRVGTGKRIVGVSDEGVQLNNGESVPADLVIWATGATAPELLSTLDLPRDDRGFLSTYNTLRSTSRRPIFAVGDTGTIAGEGLPKAGVFAVRQGPVLWDNIRAELAGKPLSQYVPQKSFLKLLNTGDGRAIGEWKGFSFAGRWVMKLKERIDSRFMNMYRVSDAMVAGMEAMQCKGCGCKLGGDVLDDALLSSETGAPLLSFDRLDDAAVIDTRGGQVLASTDFFTAPFDDAYLSGRIAALHSASDLVAMGASMSAALANVVLPEGSPADQRRMLSDLLAGARREFESMGAEIVGGHTIVGPRCEIGFTVIGEPATSQGLLRKNGLRPGDELYLTKPLGTGVLMAAHMRSACRARDYAALVDSMLQRQHKVAAVAAELKISAGTDVTGFGLAGHLLEMLRASKTSASLKLSSLPLLPGTADAFEHGIESTLAPQNRSLAASAVEATAEQLDSPEYHGLFDPQTCGGLLLGVPVEIGARLMERLASIDVTAVKIGNVWDDTAGSIDLRP